MILAITLVNILQYNTKIFLLNRYTLKNMSIRKEKHENYLKELSPKKLDII